MAEGCVAEIKQIIYHWPYQVEAITGSEHFRVGVQVLIGDQTGDDADSFDLDVCSPSMLAEMYRADRWDADEVLPGGNILPVMGVWLMKRWSRSDLEAALERLVSASSPGPGFGSVAARIGRVAPWEYDYRHDAHENRAAGLPDLGSFWHDDQ